MLYLYNVSILPVLVSMFLPFPFHLPPVFNILSVLTKSSLSDKLYRVYVLCSLGGQDKGSLGSIAVTTALSLMLQNSLLVRQPSIF